MAKIAVELDLALTRRRELGTPGFTTPRLIASGEGWSVADVVCTCGPCDRPFEEQHARYTIAIVLAGTFQYRSSVGHGLMTPGSLMLGNAGQCFECGHEHAEGDRCVSFWYAPDYFERLAADAGARGATVDFTVANLPPLRAVSPLVARAALGSTVVPNTAWEEFGVSLAARVLQIASGAQPSRCRSTPNAEARVTEIIRRIEGYPHEALTLRDLARAAGLSRYHFLRTFESLTGVTPHQYVLRARLREAALSLVAEPGNVIDVALDCGFGDISNFNRAFRAEFGVSPSEYRREA